MFCRRRGRRIRSGAYGPPTVRVFPNIVDLRSALFHCCALRVADPKRTDETGEPGTDALHASKTMLQRQKDKGWARGSSARAGTRPPLTPLESTQRPREATGGKACLAGP